ncbi:TIGR02391 family protein [Gordonia sp. 1D]|uniref:TIGR02391 family protein n=1 Tax=Gordonia sp. 1D TaxID=1737359 RepID=UPI000BB85A03|nr:TIGR02391 family protein [Gordonia sp. 1D]ATD70113.1 TIGR02391 family protein [Gordonia sp. 1D]
MPLPDNLRSFGVSNVTVIHAEGTADEARFEVEAHIQAKTGFFAVDTPIYEGDVVEFPDPRGGLDRKLAAQVDVNNAGGSLADMAHIHVTWGKAPMMRVPPVRRLTIDNLHSMVVDAAGDLFADGHYESAVSEAFKSLDVRVRDETGSTLSGTKLMNQAFGGANPPVIVSQETGQTRKDEQEGFAALFRGAMLGVRNPKAHELFKPQDPQQALEYLGFASLLHRRLDASSRATGSGLGFE